jgi:hypothetical protein
MLNFITPAAAENRQSNKLDKTKQNKNSRILDSFHARKMQPAESCGNNYGEHNTAIFFIFRAY